ncbi:MAG: Fic family protein [Phycisphaerales bacterium]
MARQTGSYRITTSAGEEVRAFIPAPLPPADPPLDVEALSGALSEALSALDLLAVAGSVVPDTAWFLYGFVRKEAVISSQIEGTQATLRDVAAFEATASSERPEDVEEVCNYVEALRYARAQLAKPAGLPLSTRLLCEVHRVLMTGARGADKLPGEVRRSQNWIGGTRPGTARFVPPPHEEVPGALAALEKWIHSDDPLPPLIKAGIAHVQFETIHPFLDGNGRVGRMLITLLVEHWGLLPAPLLYLSLAFKSRQQEYYARLAAVRDEGDWEGWSDFFLACVADAARDGVRVAKALHEIVGEDRRRVVGAAGTTVAAIRLLDLLPANPIVTVQRAAELLGLTAPPARKAIDLLEAQGVLRETSGKQRDRVYAYHHYLRALTGEGV